MTGISTIRPALGILAAIALAACGPKPTNPEPVRAVRTQVLGEQRIDAVMELAGEVRARTESRLSFRVPGQLVSRAVGLGDAVKPGQVLARLDPSDLKLGESAAQAAVNVAKAQAEQLGDEFKRYSSLRDQGFIGPAEYERRLAAMKSAQAQLEQAQAQAAVQLNQTRYAALVSDLAGVVTGIDADPGTVLAAGSPVLRVAHNGPRDVLFSVPEHRAAAFRALIGKPAALRVKPWSQDSASGSNAQELAYKATVREVSLAADPATRTFLIKADIAGAPLLLGQTVTVMMEQAAAAPALTLPSSAVFEHQGRSSVWVLDSAAMTVQAVPVEVGAAAGMAMVVRQGLAAGQEVVVAGAHTLSPGQKVQRYADPRGASAVMSR